MAKVTIIPGDGVVGVDGVFNQVDLTGIDGDIHAIQFNQESGVGHIEYVDNVKPNEPLGKQRFDLNFGKYVAAWNVANTPVERTLDEIKADARQQINGARNNAEQAGFPYMGKVIDSDSASVQRITVAVQAAQAAIAGGVAFSVDWTCQDNSILTMSAADVCGMPAALATYGNELHQHARAKKAEIDAATTAEQVAAIVW